MTDSNEFDRVAEAALNRALGTVAPVTLPAGLTDRITHAAVRDYKVRKFTRRAVWTGLAAGLLLAVWFALPKSETDTTPDFAKSPSRSFDPIREADSALASLSRSAANNVTQSAPSFSAPANLLPIPVTPTLPVSMAVLPDSALEPVTATTTRAVSRFFKDLGSATGAVRSGS